MNNKKRMLGKEKYFYIQRKKNVIKIKVIATFWKLAQLWNSYTDSQHLSSFYVTLQYMFFKYTLCFSVYSQNQQIPQNGNKRGMKNFQLNFTWKCE